MELSYIFPLHWAGWVVAIYPVQSIIEASTPQEQDSITENWKNSTLSALNSVIYIVSMGFY